MRRTGASELARAGWKRTDPRPWRSKTDARYQHVNGWTIEHCGHATALHPFMLKDPKGRPVLTGVTGTHRRPDFGTAWWNLAQVIEWMSTLDREQLETGLRWFKSRRGGA